MLFRLADSITVCHQEILGAGQGLEHLRITVYVVIHY